MAHGPIIPAGSGHKVRSGEGPSVRVYRFPWWILLIIGIVCIAAAVGLVAFPWAPVHLLAVIVGVAFIASGLSTLAVRRGSGAIIGGILLLVVGVLSIVFSDALSDLIVMFLGFGLIFAGALWLLLAVRAGGSAFLLVPALLTLAAGVVTLIWPTFALTVVAIGIGIMLFATGVFFIVQAFAMKQIPPTIIQQ